MSSAISSSFWLTVIALHVEPIGHLLNDDIRIYLLVCCLLIDYSLFDLCLGLARGHTSITLFVDILNNRSWYLRITKSLNVAISELS